jgi:hypothetical protein
MLSRFVIRLEKFNQYFLKPFNNIELKTKNKLFKRLDICFKYSTQ